MANPTDKTKYRVIVTIDGEVTENVSFATKGNSSLVFVAQNENSDRYSYKLNFGKFEKGQTSDRLRKYILSSSRGIEKRQKVTERIGSWSGRSGS